MMRTRPLTCASLALAILTIAGCGSDDESSSGEEVVLTCTSCATGPDAFRQYRHDMAMRFNEKFAGRYRIKVVTGVNEADGGQAIEAYRRLALADDLPDLFVTPAGLLDQLKGSADFMDFWPFFEDDPEFKGQFYDELFVLDDDDRLLYVPEERSVAGVFYNTDVLEQAGISEPPTTWEDFRSMAEAVNADGSIPMAEDGLWVTLLWMSHLIGTQEGGADYLWDTLADSGSEQDLASDPRWVEAVEYLRDLHVDGFANDDAYTGDFQRANAPYATGEAATIVNGPWQLTPDVVEDEAVVNATVSVPAPGDGVIAFIGEGGWSSTADTPEKQEATWEFIKFASSWKEQARRTIATNSFPAVKGEFSEQGKTKLNAANVQFAEESADAENVYPSVVHVFTQEFQDAWRNYWPAYVQGDEDTASFLDQLSAKTS